MWDFRKGRRMRVDVTKKGQMSKREQNSQERVLAVDHKWFIREHTAEHVGGQY
jgi:hypothetical protein